MFLITILSDATNESDAVDYHNIETIRGYPTLSVRIPHRLYVIIIFPQTIEMI